MSLSAKIKVTAADFVVKENLGFAAANEGQHILLYVKKQGLTTAEVVQHLAKSFEVKRLDVGYCGLKDKHAITYQYFSVDLYGKSFDDFSWLDTDKITIISAVKHLRKLKIGSHNSNEFCLVLRSVSGDKNIVEQRLNDFKIKSIMNYFGEQRFGHNNSNIEQAIAMFKGEIKVKSRNKKGMLISAARSFLFNEICKNRSDLELMAGDILQLDGSNSVFEYDLQIKSELEARLKAQEIHITAPLFGKGGKAASCDALELETKIIDNYPELKRGLQTANLLRRAMTMRVQNLSWQWQGDDLTLEFKLNKGSFATTVVDELLK